MPPMPAAIHAHPCCSPTVSSLAMPFRAPLLLAAVLGRGGVAPGLLPLLAEPASAALGGLSITARRARPAAAAPFLQAGTYSMMMMCMQLVHVWVARRSRRMGICAARRARPLLTAPPCCHLLAACLAAGVHVISMTDTGAVAAATVFRRLNDVISPFGASADNSLLSCDL